MFKASAAAEVRDKRRPILYVIAKLFTMQARFSCEHILCITVFSLAFE